MSLLLLETRDIGLAELIDYLRLAVAPLGQCDSVA